MSDNKKDIKIIVGDKKDLDISPVYDHVKINQPNSREKKKNVVIPKSNKDKNKK